jgi:hypothetical protein
MTNESTQWKGEFETFRAVEPVSPPEKISESILARVSRDLHPHPLLVFAKVAGIHAIFGTFSLLFCPQFGISPLNNNGLSRFYMQLGEHLCLAACGATFVLGSALVTAIALRREEVRVLRRTGVFQLLALGLLSLGGFAVFGADLVLELSLAWLAGWILAALGGFEFGSMVRLRFSRVGI